MKTKRIILIITIVLTVTITGAAVLSNAITNRYLNKIHKIDNINIETVAPEDEFFDTDIVPDGWSLPALETTVETVETMFETISETITETTQSITQPTTPRQSTATMIIPPNENVLPENIQLNNVESLNDEHLLNIMIIGQDYGASGARTRTDSMMLLSINTETGRIALISFLRDMLVTIPGYSDNRLNTPYVFAGLPLLYRVMELNFGVHIDYSFIIDFDGFKSVIDTLGGLDIELTEAEAKYMGIGNTRGIYHMNGATTLSYARTRRLDNDFGRTNRQRNVMTAIYDKVKQMSFGEITQLFDVFLPLLWTDMDNETILSTVKSCYKFVGNDLYTYKIPANGAYHYDYVRGMAVIMPDLPKNRAYLEYYLGLKQ